MPMLQNMDSDTELAGDHSTDSLHALDLHLTDLRKKKTDLLRQLEEVDAQIRAGEIERARVHNNLAFISKLPPELLSHIFLICQEDIQLEKDVPSFQLVASQVCSSWRSLAINTPLLWGYIEICLDHPSKLPLCLHKFEAYLNRSGPSSLYVTRLYVSRNVDFSPFLKLLEANILRCFGLYIHADEHTKAYLLLREYLESLHAPQLEYLGLYVRSKEAAQYDPILSDTPLIFKGGAPALTCLILSGLAGALRPSISSGITTLHIDGAYMKNLTVLTYRELLSSVPSLVNLSLRDLQLEGQATSVSLDLPHLRSLRFRSKNSEHSIISMLSALPLHQLETLTLCELDDLWTFTFPNVKNLSLHDCRFGVSQIGHLMLAFPSVESLTLECSSLLYLALGIEGNPVWWPRLRTLCARDLVTHEVAILLKMVEGRQLMNQPLETVSFDTRSHRRARLILDQLKQVTTILLTHESPEPWPAGLGFDQVDGFWDLY